MYVLLSAGDQCMMVPVQLPNTPPQPQQQNAGHFLLNMPQFTIHSLPPPAMPAPGVSTTSTGSISQESLPFAPVQLPGASTLAGSLPPLSGYGLCVSSAVQHAANMLSHPSGTPQHQKHLPPSHTLSHSSGDTQQQQPSIDIKHEPSSSFSALQLPPWVPLSQHVSAPSSSSPCLSLPGLASLPPYLPPSLISTPAASRAPSTDKKQSSSDSKKQHECNECGKFFTRKFNLKQHMRIHLNIKPFVCDVCDKAFTQKHSLKHHSRTHTGDKPFECDFCAKRFAVKYNLTTHRRIHTGEKPYVCQECDSRFTSRSGLTSHIRHNH